MIVSVLCFYLGTMFLFHSYSVLNCFSLLILQTFILPICITSSLLLYLFSDTSSLEGNFTNSLKSTSDPMDKRDNSEEIQPKKFGEKNQKLLKLQQRERTFWSVDIGEWQEKSTIWVTF
jgi:hypothetical protein